MHLIREDLSGLPVESYQINKIIQSPSCALKVEGKDDVSFNIAIFSTRSPLQDTVRSSFQKF